MLDIKRNNDDGRSRHSSAMRRPRGFTLVELIVVIVIISIILVFMLNASMNAVRSANEKATQGLIAKLDQAVSDRIDAILQTRISQPTAVQAILAQIYDGMTPMNASNSERALVLAQIELFQRELPDVFYVQSDQDSTVANYPLNFAANPYPIADGSPNLVKSSPPTDALYVLPLGTGWPMGVNDNYFNPGLGIYGASYHVAAGVYKNLGYLPTGFDGVDNNGNGLVDEWDEGVTKGVNDDLVTANLKAHTHKTARAEMLYALLVESQGPFGSLLNRDDFTDKEVQDTDGDGLPEFVDAWGEPLQFYRWPLLFHSDLQRGQRFLTGSSGAPAFAPAYDNMIQQRELDALDPNQQLMSPAWWSSNFNDATQTSPVAVPPFPGGFSAVNGRSPGAVFFESHFHLLHDPLQSPGSGSTPGLYWDRGWPSGDFASRRAFSSKFLILSAGPDKELGVFQFDRATLESSIATASGNLLGGESLAAPLAYDDLQNLVTEKVTYGADVSSNSVIVQTQGQDDINNHSIPAGGIGGSAP